MLTLEILCIIIKYWKVVGQLYDQNTWADQQQSCKKLEVDSSFNIYYNIYLKNPTSYSENSSNFDEKENYDLFGTFKVDTSLPLQKKMDDYINYLIPIQKSK